MKIVFIKEEIKAKEKQEIFYCLKVALVDENKSVIKKSKVLMWLTKEQFDNLKI